MRGTILIISIGAVIFGGMWESKYLKNSCNFVLADIEYMENEFDFEDTLELDLDEVRENV